MSLAIMGMDKTTPKQNKYIWLTHNIQEHGIQKSHFMGWAARGSVLTYTQ